MTPLQELREKELRLVAIDIETAQRWLKLEALQDVRACSKGHLLTPENVYQYGREERCRQCVSERKTTNREKLWQTIEVSIA